MVERRLKLYSRHDCHLCHEAAAMLERIRREPGARFELEILDVDRDPETRRLYGGEIPVLLVDGKKFAKVRVDEARLRRKLNLQPRGSPGSHPAEDPART